MNSFSTLFKRVFRHLSWGVLSSVVVVVTMLYVQGCSGPPLKPWHTEHLSEEFTVKMTDEVRTFGDYLKLEERLFAQLEEEVYAETETGPEYALARYSSGSKADPQGRQPNWNHSQELTATTPHGGILLLHGMSDSPYSLRALGEALNQRGYWVLALRLPGHGTSPSGLTSVRWQDMSAAVRLGMEHLATQVGEKPIHILGYSTGAPLALDFALNAMAGEASPIPASLVLISPAIGLHPAAAMAKWKRRLSILPGLGGMAWLLVMQEFDPYKYNSFATNAAEQVHSLTSSVASRIATHARSNPDELLPPILVFKSTVDATVSNNAVIDRLLGRLPPHRHELVLFDINRFAAHSILLVSDPGPWTAQLMENNRLPFAVTLVTNVSPESTAVETRSKAPLSAEITNRTELDLIWPTGVFSLSHVALPIPADDPLYGQYPPDNKNDLFLGALAVQGERDLLKLPSDWMLRLRYNPFYAFLETRTLAWLKEAQSKVTMNERSSP